MLRTCVLLALVAAPLIWCTPAVSAQGRVGSDSATRLTRLGRAFAYGTVTGLAFTAVDQWQTQPPEWGKGWRGFGKRAASNLGEFYIQEGVTEGLAAVMNRPLDYLRCKCRGTGDRMLWALQAGFTDQMADGTHPIAVPRIVGAYAGSFAQAAWRPPGSSSRLTNALVNGTTSLGIGVLINMFYEFRHPPLKESTMAGDRK